MGRWTLASHPPGRSELSLDADHQGSTRLLLFFQESELDPAVPRMPRGVHEDDVRGLDTQIDARQVRAIARGTRGVSAAAAVRVYPPDPRTGEQTPRQTLQAGGALDKILPANADEVIRVTR